MEWTNVISAFASAITGGVIGGGFAVIAANLAHKNNLHLQKEAQQKMIDGILRGIRDELQILGQIYDQNTGGELEKAAEGEPFWTYFLLSDRYLVVYPNNVNVVGHIDDPDLSKAIVVTYNTATALIAAFRINNSYIDCARNLSATTPDPVFQSELLQTMGRHTQKLKAIDSSFRNDAAALLANIESYRQVH